MSTEDIKETFENSEEDYECDAPISAIPNIKSEAFPGIIKKFVDAASENSEASPVAIAANVISWFCASVNRRAYQWIGDSLIHCRPFFLLVGKSGKARKGTAEALPRRVFKRVDDIRKEKYPFHQSLNIHSGGLSSGEGICYAIRDATEGKDDDQGITDKRLLVIEAEFANVLASCKRETSTLSAVIRNVYDGRNLAPLTKTNRTHATNPHVVIIGHITAYELISKINNGVEATNGLLNRFLICSVAREKLVALPAPTSSSVIEELAMEIVSVFEFIESQVEKSTNAVEIKMGKETEEYWERIYSTLSKDDPGIIGSLLARAEVYARMLAMIFALLDKKLTIEISHLKASLRWMAYVNESIWYLFGDMVKKIEDENSNDAAEKILAALKENGEMTKTEISKIFKGHKSSTQIDEALGLLLNQTPTKIIQIHARTRGRSKTSYKLK